MHIKFTISARFVADCAKLMFPNSLYLHNYAAKGNIYWRWHQLFKADFMVDFGVQVVEIGLAIYVEQR